MAQSRSADSLLWLVKYIDQGQEWQISLASSRVSVSRKQARGLRWECAQLKTKSPMLQTSRWLVNLTSLDMEREQELKQGMLFFTSIFSKLSALSMRPLQPVTTGQLASSLLCRRDIRMFSEVSTASSPFYRQLCPNYTLSLSTDPLLPDGSFPQQSCEGGVLSAASSWLSSSMPEPCLSSLLPALSLVSYDLLSQSMRREELSLMRASMGSSTMLRECSSSTDFLRLFQAGSTARVCGCSVVNSWRGCTWLRSLLELWTSESWAGQRQLLNLL